jgi:hypothetical protein
MAFSSPRTRVRCVSKRHLLLEQAARQSPEDELVGWKTLGSGYVQPSSFKAKPAFHILVMWAILPPSNCITYT